MLSLTKCEFLARDRQHIAYMLSALYAIDRPSVRLSVRLHTGGGSVETFEVRIMKFSPYGNPGPHPSSFYRDRQGKFHPEILMGHPSGSVKLWRGG